MADLVIDRIDLPGLIETAGKGAKMVSIIANTDPRMKGMGPRGNNPLRGRNIRKRSWVNGVAQWSYGNAVNRQRDREDQPLDGVGNVEHFTPQARKWGVKGFFDEGAWTPSNTGPWILHKDALYFELKVQKSVAHEYIDMDSGERIDPALIREWLPVRRPSATQGVDKQIILRDYALINLEAIVMDGDTWFLADTPDHGREFAGRHR